MTRRNEAVADTRQRIVDAAVELHGTVGPAATSIAGIAEAAGVTRLTVYRHFPDAEALFAACSAHWLSTHLAPRPDLWVAISEPDQRLKAALKDLYRFYREGAQMLALVHRDEECLPDTVRRRNRADAEAMRELVLSAFGSRGTGRSRLAAVVGHAMSFETWRSLCVEQGLSNPAAVDVMVTLVEVVAESPARGQRAMR